MSQLSSPATMSHSRFGPFGLNSSSSLSEHATRCFFRSLFKRYGIHLSASFFLWRFLYRMLSMVPIERSHASLNSHTVECGSSSISLSTYAMLCSFRPCKIALNGYPNEVAVSFLLIIRSICRLCRMTHNLCCKLLANFHVSTYNRHYVAALWKRKK